MLKRNLSSLLLVMLFAGSLIACGTSDDAAADDDDAGGTTEQQQDGVNALQSSGFGASTASAQQGLIAQALTLKTQSIDLPCDAGGTFSLDASNPEAIVFTFNDCDFGDGVIDGSMTVSASTITFEDFTVVPDNGCTLSMSGSVEITTTTISYDMTATSDDGTYTISGDLTVNDDETLDGTLTVSSDGTTILTCILDDFDASAECAEYADTCGVDPDEICNADQCSL